LNQAFKKKKKHRVAAFLSQMTDRQQQKTGKAGGRPDNLSKLQSLLSSAPLFSFSTAYRDTNLTHGTGLISTESNERLTGSRDHGGAPAHAKLLHVPALHWRH